MLSGLLLLSPAGVWAKATPLDSVGRIEGKDISVEGPSAPGSESDGLMPSILVGNGGVVIVHSGQARLTLLSGGEVDICGPAKFTVLRTGGAVTLAVELGRMRVEVPATATLRLFTPTIVATPLEISGGTRDVTLGLDQDNSLCVLATSGAIQLEHQFSGEQLIVPQTGEFFLNAGKLLPVVGKPGSCQCAAMEKLPPTQTATRPSEFADTVAPLRAPGQPAPASDQTASPASAPDLEFSLPAHANQGHPVAPAEKTTAAPVTAPAMTTPVYTVVAPPLTFTASAPSPPPEPPLDSYLLVREAQVAPDWEFKGHVDPPTFAAAMQRALGEGPTPSQPPAEPSKRRRNRIWGFFRRIF